MINRIVQNAANAEQLARLLQRDGDYDRSVEDVVRNVLAEVRANGNSAVLEFTAKFDRLTCDTINELDVSLAQCQQELAALPLAQRNALEKAAERIRFFHEHQRLESWEFSDDYQNRLGQQVTALERVGVYVPGGKASYPSSVLMNVIPAKVAGVESVTMVVPAPDGYVRPIVLAAAAVAGADRVITIGGSQAVAALAYGTETIQAVDKIVGPGNDYVAEAKRQVFGHVGLDMIAGPSEILIIADGSAPAEWVAMDLFSQAEHDENAQAILISTSASYLDEVESALAKLIETMPRRDIIEASLANRGVLIEVEDLDAAMALSNSIAPEHLELCLENAKQWQTKVKHAGAIFVGKYAAEALGDYSAGPNHVLPTSGSARFSSPLGVYDFQKRTSIIDCSQHGASVLGELAAELADAESLAAHAASARYRVK